MISRSDIERFLAAEYTDEQYVSMARTLDGILDDTVRVLVIAKALKAEYRRGARKEQECSAE